MTKLFISYAEEDSTFVNRLDKDIEMSTELTVVIDKRCLKVGDSLTKIFGEIGTSDFLLPVISKHSIKSRWCQKELRIAIIKEIDEDSFKVVPIIKGGENWNELKSELHQDLKEALRDKFIGRFDNKIYEEAFLELSKLPARKRTGVIPS